MQFIIYNNILYILHILHSVFFVQTNKTIKLQSSMKKNMIHSDFRCSPKLLGTFFHRVRHSPCKPSRQRTSSPCKPHFNLSKNIKINRSSSFDRFACQKEEDKKVIIKTVLQASIKANSIKRITLLGDEGT